MHSIHIRFVAALALFLILPCCARWRKMSDEQWANAVKAQLQTEVASVGRAGRGVIEGEKIASPADLTIFYKHRGFQPAWIEGKKASSQVPDLLQKIREADAEGLNPAAYHLATLEKLERAMKEHEGEKEGVPIMSRYDALLSDAFLTYGGHLAYGSLNPRAINPDWAIERVGPKMPQVLEAAIESKSVKKTLEGLPPQKDGYRDLKAAYAKYREIAAKGGWGSIPKGDELDPGDTDPRVPALRARLAQEGLLPSAQGSDEYDKALSGAVAQFQQTHGLKATGTLDDATVAALDVPVGDRMRDIQVNLERWRWLPRELGEHYVFVDIANFQLTVFDKGKPVLEMPVVVGKDTQNTPVFDDQIMYIVLNPTWNVPKSIVANEIAPQMARDPSYLSRKGMELYKPVGKHDKVPVSPSSVDWKNVTEDNFKLLVSQPPGPKNPLGSIKFLFPNEFAVYMHGTPVRRTFKKNVRTESHGCIRVEKPLELAEYLLKETDSSWDEKKLLAAIHDGNEHTIRLKEPVDVHIFYWTAWVDGSHRLNFRKDVYGWDRPVLTALQRAQAPRRVAE